jgi:3-hydroxyisobutyrate dehydrogenase
MIAILGTGLLGTGFTQALRAKGEDVRVWNRSHARAKAVEKDGARAFEDPAEAIAGASRVHIVVSDDAAVDAVLAAARPRADVWVIDHTTTSTEGARRRTARADLTYVHAPVFMGPQNARDATGLMLVSGARSRVEHVTPLLAAMTGKVIDLGERVDAAAAFKLMGNTFLMGFTTAIGDMIGLGTALGIAPAEAIKLFEHFNPGNTTLARATRMASGSYGAPSWTLEMARKDARLVEAELAQAKTNVALALVPVIAARMDEMIKRGHGHDDWTVLAQDYVSASKQ